MRSLLMLSMAAAVMGQNPLPHTVLPVDLENQARHQLYAAYGAYCKKEAIENWDCKWCKDVGPAKVYGVVDNSSKTEGQAYVVKTNDSQQVIVSFRGSQNLDNWLADFDYFKTDLTWAGVPKGVEVHRGFLHSYLDLKTKVFEWVAAAMKECPTCSLFVTGHSLGAAQAALCTTDLRIAGYNPFMWTFGEPRVGNKAFYEYFYSHTTHPVYRMVNKKDIVPHLPPGDLGFHHRQREVWRMENDTYIMCNNMGEDHNCSRSIPLEKASVIDHTLYMGRYAACI